VRDIARSCDFSHSTISRMASWPPCIFAVPIRDRTRSDEALAEIGHSYNVSAATISRLAP